MVKKKILRIIARLNIGGPAIHTVLLTAFLDKEQFESILICGNISKDEGSMLYYAEEHGVKPLIIPDLRRELNLWSDLLALIKIYRIIKAERPDIVHTHTAKAGALGRLAVIIYNLHFFRRNKPKLVHTFHGHIFGGYFSKINVTIFLFIERFLAIFTDRIITVSDSVRNSLLHLSICKNDKIKVIPLGFELERFLSLEPRSAPSVNIGIIGRLVPIKNHNLFLDAVSNVVKNFPEKKLRFEVIGDGQLREGLEKRASELGLNDYVYFQGWNNNIADSYRDLDILALTSLSEGTPVSVIEAMASGRASVATDVGGVRDLLGGEVRHNVIKDRQYKVVERGIIVESFDPKDFAGALSLAIQDSALRKQIGLRAREFAAKRFSKERLLDDMRLLYDDVLASDPKLL